MYVLELNLEDAEDVDDRGETCFAPFGSVALGKAGRLEGSVGLGSGGCALSDSVTASAAARSAARWACWDVEGGSEVAFGGNAGFDRSGMVSSCSHD